MNKKMVYMVVFIALLAALNICYGCASTKTKSLQDHNLTFLQAVKKGDISLVRTHLAKEAQINVRKSKIGTEALLAAALDGHADIVKLLFEEGADLYHANGSSDISAETLALVAHNGHEDIINLLLQQGIDVDSRTSGEGYTALMAASARGKTGCVKLLLDMGADANAISSDGMGSPMTAAADKGKTEVIKILLEDGADIDTKLASGATPLILAATNGHTDSVALLLKQGADANDVLPPASSPVLMLAAVNGHSSVVKLLIDHGAEVNKKNDKDASALSMAIANGKDEVVRLLLLEGADTGIELIYEGVKHTPLSLARLFKHTKIIELLEKADESSPVHLVSQAENDGNNKTNGNLSEFSSEVNLSQQQFFSGSSDMTGQGVGRTCKRPVVDFIDASEFNHQMPRLREGWFLIKLAQKLGYGKYSTLHSGQEYFVMEKSEKERVLSLMTTRIIAIDSETHSAWKNALSKALGGRSLDNFDVNMLLLQVDRLYVGESLSKTESKRLLARVDAVSAVKGQVGVSRATNPGTFLSLVADDKLFPGEKIDVKAFSAALKED